MNIPFPRRLHEIQVFPFIQRMWQAVNEKELIFDLTLLEFSFPFGSLILAEEIKRFVAHRSSRGFVTQASGYSTANPVHTYLAHIGFFEYQGLPVGNKPGDAPGSATYMPFEILDREKLEERMRGAGISLGQAVQEESERLTRIVLQLDEKVHSHPVAYCFREVIRNVYEHGLTSSCSLCAQRWADGRLEIAVVDRGRGILNSLSEKYNLSSHLEALCLAIEPGVTRAKEQGDVDDEWQNSGYGLYVLSQLANQTGAFLLCSGDTAIQYKNSQILQQPYPFEGTAVKLHLQKPKGMDVRQMIRQIVKEGEQQQPTSERKSPSKSTSSI